MTEFDAANFLLRTSCIGDQSAEFIDYQHRTIDFPALHCDRMWSEGETCIIDAAWDIFNGGGTCSISRCLAVLDNENYAVLVRALELVRPDAFATNLAGVPS